MPRANGRPRRLQTVPDSPGRVLLYRRVSAVMGRGGETFHSPELQTAAMEQLVGRLGLREVLPPDGQPVTDLDVSGRGFSREGLDKVRAMAHAGQVDVIAVYDLSRLGRNVREALNFIAELRDLGVSIVSAKEQIDDSTQGQFMLGQYLLLAELYSNQMSDAWAAVAERRAHLGQHNGIPPTGYKRAGQNAKGQKSGPLVEDPDAAPAVRWLFEQHAAGIPMSALTRGFAERIGRRVDRKTVRRIVSNKAYLGMVRLHDEWLPGAHDALVEAEVWEECQLRLRRDGRTPPRTLAAAHSMAGLARCDDCGQLVRHNLDRQRGYGRLRHVTALEADSTCRPPGYEPTPGRPGWGTPRLPDVEQIVLEQLRQYAAGLRTDPKAALERSAARTVAAADRRRVTDQLARGRSALAQLTIDYATRDIGEQAYRLASAELEASVEQLQRRLDDLDAADAAAPDEPGQAASLVDQIIEVWPAATGPERSLLLRRALAEVRIRHPRRYGEPLADRVQIVPH